MPAAGMCTLRVSRGRQYADRLRSYKIFVNGAQVGTIPVNDEFDVQVPAGRMTVEARIDWTRSAPLEIDAAEGQTVELEVANDWSPMLAIWAVTFGAYSYLTLRRKDGPSPV